MNIFHNSFVLGLVATAVAVSTDDNPITWITQIEKIGPVGIIAFVLWIVGRRTLAREDQINNERISLAKTNNELAEKLVQLNERSLAIQQELSRKQNEMFNKLENISCINYSTESSVK